MIFPLPLTAIEHYMLAEDSACYPCCFSLVFHLNMELEEATLRAAIAIAVARHPLLASTIEKQDDRPSHWIARPEYHYLIEWQSDEATTQTVGIDPFVEPGVRFTVVRGSEGDTLRIDFHHVCTDGLGAIQFSSDLLTAYGLDSGTIAAVLPAIDVNKLKTRDRYGLTGWRRLTRLFYGSVGWLGAIEFFSHRPVALGTLDESPPDAMSRGSAWRALTEEQTSELLQFAKQSGVTLNDLLVSELFGATQQFIAEHTPANRDELQRVMIPTNLRVPDDATMPAANVVAMINLDRRPSRWKNRQRVLRWLHREMTVVKRMRLGLTFIQIVGTFLRLFGSLRKLLPLDRCLATCVFSNLGRAMPADLSERVVGVEFYPPLRPHTSASFGLITHRDQMMFSLRFDLAAMSEAQGEQLLECWVQRINDCLSQDTSKEYVAAGADHAT